RRHCGAGAPNPDKQHGRPPGGRVTIARKHPQVGGVTMSESGTNWSFDQMMRLDGKKMIAAGVGGLGQAIALGLADAGADLVVADLNEAAAESAAELIRAKGRQAFAIRLDVSKAEECQKVVAFAVEKFGRLDGLFNGVGINIRGPSLEVTEAQWDRLHAVNTKGGFFFAQAAARQYVKQGTGGKIITIASHLGIVGMEERTSYSASKAAIINMTRSLAHEWAQYKINVNALAPCFTRTAINAETMDDPVFFGKLMERFPIKRLGKPEDLVGAVIYMSAPASDFMTGQTMVVDGGWLTW
ncbi:MAG: SDR family NAD(P)-dependent oxidoreductase, partial [Chloroflexota bacterium]